MALPTSGPIHLAQIGYEAGKPLMSQVDMNATDLRKLCNKLTTNSQVSAQDFYGTAYGVGPGYGPQTFTNTTGVGLSVYVTSTTIYLHDAPVGGAAMALQSTSGASYSLNGGAWTDKSVLGNVKRGDSIALRVKSSGTQQTTVDAQIVYSGITKSWSVTTATMSASRLLVFCNAQSSYGYLTGTTTLVSKKSFHWFVSADLSSGTYTYAGVYTFGAQLANPDPAVNTSITKYWTLAALPSDSLYVSIAVGNDGPTTASMDAKYGSSPGNSTLPGVYMGQTGVTGYASYSQGFRLNWKET